MNAPVVTSATHTRINSEIIRRSTKITSVFRLIYWFHVLRNLIGYGLHFYWLGYFYHNWFNLVPLYHHLTFYYGYKVGCYGILQLKNMKVMKEEFFKDLNIPIIANINLVANF